MNKQCILSLDAFDNPKEIIKETIELIETYKIGLKLFSNGEAMELIKILNKENRKVFADLKLFDIPNTVKETIKSLKDLQVSMTTVHADKNSLIAAAEVKDFINVLAVCSLTSDDRIYYSDYQRKVGHSIRNGADGVIASGLDIAFIRAKFGENIKIVTPGIRLEVDNDDQKRVVSPRKAINCGADYIVLGREVANSKNPKDKLKNIISDINNSII